MPYKLFSALAFHIGLCCILSAQKADDYQLAMYSENWNNAVVIQEKRCSKSPLNWIGWLYMADAFNAASRPLDARKALQNAARQTISPTYQDIIAGRIELIDDHFSEAFRHFNKAAKAGKKDLIASRLLGESWLYGRFRNFRQAEKYLLAGVKRNNFDYQVHMDLGYCYKMLHNTGKAFAQYDLANSISPENPLPVFMSSLLYKNAKIQSKQLEYLNKSIALDPDFKEALLQKAELFYAHKHNYAQAADAYAHLFEISSTISAKDEISYVNCLFFMKQYEKTIEWVNKIIQKDSNLRYLRRLLAYSLYETGEIKKGQAIMDAYFASVTPEMIIPLDYEYYAKFLRSDKKDSLSEIYYKKAIALDPSRWDLYGEIASIRYKARNYLGAFNAYKRRLDSLKTCDANDYYQIGMACYMLQDPDNCARAARYFAKVVRIEPEKTIGWLMLAKALSKLEPDIESHPKYVAQFGKAKTAYEHFVEIAEFNPDENKKDLISAYKYLGYFYALQKNNKKSHIFYNKLMALDPIFKTSRGTTDSLQAGTTNY